MSETNQTGALPATDAPVYHPSHLPVTAGQAINANTEIVRQPVAQSSTMVSAEIRRQLDESPAVSMPAAASEELLRQHSMPIGTTSAPTRQPEPQVPAAAPTETAKKANFAVDRPYTTEGDKNFSTDNETAVMPSGTTTQILDALRDTPNVRNVDANTQRYIDVIQEAVKTLPMADGFVDTANREGAHFVQQVQSSTSPLMGYEPKFKKKEGVKYSGESARNLIRSAMKLGTVFAVPLWHSGFWITLRSPTEGQLLELYRKITQEKSTLGRSTYGLMFSNMSSYTNKAILDFIVDNYYETSLELGDNDNIRDFIQLPDLSLLIWGLACATWPNGFQYNRACITDVDKCKHVISEKLNLSRLLWTDTTSLTAWQIQHMTNRQRGSVNQEAVKKYRNEFLRGNNQKVQVTEDLSFILKMPTAKEHIDSGYRWVTQIEEDYGRAMTIDSEDRNDYLLKHAQATSMRQYAHCVHSIVVGEDEIDGVEEIEAALNDLTARDDLRDDFMQKVGKFLDDSVVSFVGIPTYTCPACGGHQRHAKVEGEDKSNVKYPELIPLDVAQTFFPLLSQRFFKISNR